LLETGNPGRKVAVLTVTKDEDVAGHQKQIYFAPPIIATKVKHLRVMDSTETGRFIDERHRKVLKIYPATF
jgi:hypothetical protein